MIRVVLRNALGCELSEALAEDEAEATKVAVEMITTSGLREGDTISLEEAP